MTSALESIRGIARSPSSAVLAACTLEATAPKAGNVHPAKSFDSLRYEHFMVAAQIASQAIDDRSRPVSLRIMIAAQKTAMQIKTNVNLGILLLMAPLIIADESQPPTSGADSDVPFDQLDDWRNEVARAIDQFTPDDSQALLRTIQISQPGGMGEVDEMDLHRTDTTAYDMVAAMRLARSRDRIARQYADGFNDFFDHVVPVVAQSFSSQRDPLAAIADAHLVLLANDIDTLIQRKCGHEVAAEVQRRAGEVDRNDTESRQRFDDFLRSDSNRMNPGTTADLIAAALYVLMRTAPAVSVS